MQNFVKSIFCVISIISVQAWAGAPQGGASNDYPFIARLRDGFNVSTDPITKNAISDLKAALTRVNHPDLNAIIEKQLSAIIWKPATSDSSPFTGTIPAKVPARQDVIQYDIENSRPLRRLVEKKFQSLSDAEKPRALMHSILTSADPNGTVSSEVPAFKNQQIYQIIKATFDSKLDPEVSRSQISTSLRRMGFQLNKPEGNSAAAAETRMVPAGTGNHQPEGATVLQAH